ncbi:Autophagy-related protein 3 [Penicillium expansum]|uniref:Ubiquitin-like-conjugating enzyme ATG10 n=1 Tax=Penicillium expansum TaxID=27334 RepID=A0A0A2IDN1_PENEN|nr:Autophagy-related protein 3 [Penicillium expansum]KGO39099.1 Autophagy-related protein 3 [Penicillium expansum]KGO40548.1 Autophagy-related protein 3 [Penicillium expansum]KGO49421.1 Autophagy-related protein 3 [Penicillium expansum]
MAASCSAFPFLAQSEFESACQDLADRCTSAQHIGWSAIRLLTKPDGTSLRITKYVNVPSPLEAPALVDEESQEDEDPEALVRAKPQPSLQIDYDILLSPTYQVPVLYFGLRWHNHGPLGLDHVYQYVVPERYRQELKSVGVMGGISMGYHPDSGAPAFFVHPCNTADAMANVADAQSVTPGSYLLIWLGLVGHCVNLHVPRELFA